MPQLIGIIILIILVFKFLKFIVPVLVFGIFIAFVLIQVINMLRKQQIENIEKKINHKDEIISKYSQLLESINNFCTDKLEEKQKALDDYNNSYIKASYKKLEFSKDYKRKINEISSEIKKIKISTQSSFSKNSSFYHNYYSYIVPISPLLLVLLGVNLGNYSVKSSYTTTSVNQEYKPQSQSYNTKPREVIKSYDTSKSTKIVKSNNKNIYSSKAKDNNKNIENRIKNPITIAESQVTSYEITNNSNLVAYFPFNGNARDESVVGNFGVVEGAILSTDYHGNKNQAYEFNGKDNVISVPYSRRYVIRDKITLASWIFPTEKKSQDIIYNGYSLSLSATGDIIFSLYIDNKYVQLRKSGYLLNRWTHITGTYDGKSMKLYINGRLEKSKLVTGKLYIAERPILIGTLQRLPSSTFKGKIDEVLIYNNSIDYNEVKKIFTKTKGQISYTKIEEKNTEEKNIETNTNSKDEPFLMDETPNLTEVVENIEGSEILNKEFLIVMSTSNYTKANKYAKHISKTLNIQFDERAKGRSNDGVYITIEESNNYKQLKNGYYIVVVASGKSVYKILSNVKKVSPTAYIKKATTTNIEESNDQYQPIVEEKPVVEQVIEPIRSSNFNSSLGKPINRGSTVYQKPKEDCRNSALGCTLN